MQLVPVQCSHCGAGVEVDAYTKSFVCNVCGGSTIIENSQHHSDFHDNSINKAEMLIDNQDNYSKAKSEFEYLTTSYPDDPRPWIGLIRCYTNDLTIKLYIDVSPYQPIWLTGLENRIMNAFNNYNRVETKEQEKAHTEQVFMDYINKNKEEFESLKEKNKDDAPAEVVSGEAGSSFNETIKAENRIIKAEDIRNIVVKMDESLKKYQYISKKEEEVNKSFDYDEKEYTFKDNGSKIKFDIDFHDNTSASIDSVDEFLYIYDNRLSEIKSLNIRYGLHYDVETPKPNKKYDYMSQSIELRVRENKLSIDVDLKSADDKLSNIYKEIKNMVLNAPTKYDDIIKKRTGITIMCGLGIGLIPGLVIGGVLLSIEQARLLFASTYVLFPILVFFISMVIGTTISTFILNGLYSNIKPDQKYAGYKDGKSVYTDDVDDYVNSSEILIGKNVHNMEDRESIKKLLEKCKKMFLVELVILLFISILVVFIFNIMA